MLVAGARAPVLVSAETVRRMRTGSVIVDVAVDQGGCIETIHPTTHAGILADRRRPEHQAQLAELGIEPFDLVVVNLYPFRETAASGAGPEDVIEKIDVGGPAMVRAAAKNHASVGVVVNPERYSDVLGELRLDACRIPAGRRLGEEGDGMRLAMATLDFFRASVGAAACGLASRALEEAGRRAQARRQFGTPIAQCQPNGPGTHTNTPCWFFDVDTNQCASTTSHLALRYDYGTTPPPSGGRLRLSFRAQ